MKMKKVITLGPKFSYSYNLTKEVYGDYDIECVGSIGEVFERINQSENLIGIVPIENMINGSVRETFIGLKKYKVKILSAYDYAIHHCLAAQDDNFEKIVSHPQALAQSSDFLKQYRDKGVEITDVSSTSKGLEMATQDSKIAAVGSRLGVDSSGLKLIGENIENNSNNKTRFIEIVKSDEIGIDGDKTSMIIEPKVDRAGLLFEILAVFKIKDINLTKIESLPTGEKIGEYIFYLDLDANLEDERMVDAIEFLKTFVNVYLFGSYNVVNR